MSKKFNAKTVETMCEGMPRLLSVAQVAERTGYKKKTVYWWIQSGKLDGCYVKRGKHIRIPCHVFFELFLNGPWEESSS